MAKTSKQKAAAAETEVYTPPAPCDIWTAMKAILEYNKTLAPSIAAGKMEPLVHPCIIGTSGTGKTMGVHALAAERERNLATTLLGTMMPEEIGGAPRPKEIEGEDHVGELFWFLPSYAFTDNLMLFMDEADKADRQHWAQVLTLMTSLKLRDKPLKPGTEIVMAMQPVSRAEFLADETGKALSARMCFLPTGMDESINYLQRKHGVKLDWFGSHGVSGELPVNLSPRGLDWILGFARWVQQAYNEDWQPILFRVALGMGTHDQALKICETAVERNETDPSCLVESLRRDISRVNKLPLQMINSVLGYVWEQDDLKLLEECMFRFLAETPVEQVANVQGQLVEHLVNRCNANPDGQWVDVLGDADEKMVSEAIARASKRACEYRLQKLREAGHEVPEL